MRQILPTLPDAEQYAADQSWPKGRSTMPKMSAFAYLHMARKYLYEDRARRTSNIRLRLDGLAQVIPLLLQVVVF